VVSAVAACAALIPFGLYSLWLGQDANWDQRLYHVYDAYAWLAGRRAHDVLAAGLQTFLPPFHTLPFYLMVRHWPPMLAGFALGILHGSNVILVVALVRAVVAVDSPYRSASVAIAAAVGMLSPATMSELGTSFGDNVLSLPVLASVLCMVRRPDALEQRWPPLAGGVLAGMAAGLKYTNAIYAVALLAAVAWSVARRGGPASAWFRVAAGIGVGAVTVEGAWAWQLWERFGNPVFPFFNGVFRSPYWIPTNFQDPRWIPTGVWDGLGYPFQIAWTQARTMEPPFRDTRWAVLAILAAGCGVAGIARRVTTGQLRPSVSASSAASELLAVFGAVAFGLWVFAFGYQRYLVPLELMSGVFLLIACQALSDEGRRGFVLFVALASLVVATVRTPSWGRLPWDRSWFDVRFERAVPPHAMVLLTHPAPYAYLAPFFPRGARFVKLTITGPGKGYGPALESEIAATIAAHRARFLLLVKGAPSNDDRAVLERHRLEISDDCWGVHSRMDEDLRLCRVVRADP
jgi:hypothetical protein